MTEKRAPQGGKAGWTVLVVFVPLIGVLIYVAVHGREMSERQLGGGPVGPDMQDSYATSTSSEFAKLADLHDRGVITDAEFEREKQKILHERPRVSSGARGGSRQEAAHGKGRPAAMANRSPTVDSVVRWSASDAGDRPGAVRGIRTRRAPGRTVKTSGGVIIRVSPSIPISTGLSEPTSNLGVSHSSHPGNLRTWPMASRATKRAAWSGPPILAATTPRTPSSRCSRVPRPPS